MQTMGGSPNSNANMASLSILIAIQRARNEAMVASWEDARVVASKVDNDGVEVCQWNP